MRQLRLRARRLALVVRQFGIAGPGFVALREQSERQAVSGASPPGFCTGKRSRRLAGIESLVFLLDTHVTRLQQPAKVSCGEVGFNPVAEAEQGTTRACRWRRDARAERDRPLVTKRLLPNQRDVRIRRAGDLDLVERRTSGENAAEHLFNFGFAAAGVEESDVLARRSRFVVRGPRSAVRVRFRGK